jgi:hypothetical protein
VKNQIQFPYWSYAIVGLSKAKLPSLRLKIPKRHSK